MNNEYDPTDAGRGGFFSRHYTRRLVRFLFKFDIISRDVIDRVFDRLYRNVL